jgi:hypothetical protein
MEKEVYQQNYKISQNPAEHQAQLTAEKSCNQCNGEAEL